MNLCEAACQLQQNCEQRSCLLMSVSRLCLDLAEDSRRRLTLPQVC